MIGMDSWWMPRVAKVSLSPYWLRVMMRNPARSLKFIKSAHCALFTLLLKNFFRIPWCRKTMASSPACPEGGLPKSCKQSTGSHHGSGIKMKWIDYAIQDVAAHCHQLSSWVNAQHSILSKLCVKRVCTKSCSAADAPGVLSCSLRNEK